MKRGKKQFWEFKNQKRFLFILRTIHFRLYIWTLRPNLFNEDSRLDLQNYSFSLFIFVYIFEPCDPVPLMKTLALISKLTRDERGGAGERHVELGGERGQKHRRHSKVLAAANQQNNEFEFWTVLWIRIRSDRHHFGGSGSLSIWTKIYFLQTKIENCDTYDADEKDKTM